jgi:iron complex outermembrane recepter protein
VKKNTCCLLLLLCLYVVGTAQQKTAADSALLLDKVVITAFQQNREVNAGTIVKVISNNMAGRFNKNSLLQGFNAVAGVRMEERSPGSYRINIRGSSLRAPFGVRNVKVYWNGLPVTDAGGSTYFNQFAFNNFSSIEIIKGPAGSMYGAGTGGVLLLHSFQNAWQPSVQAEYSVGSYGQQQVLASAGFGSGNSRTRISYAHAQSDGYRHHTNTQKDNLALNTQLIVSDREQITASLLYSNQYYQTPGGLTRAEFMANPKQARPAAGGFPAAAVAKAAIYQKNFLAGFQHQYKFSPGFTNATSLYGSFAQIQNPTFRNYERRTEPGFGGRTVFTFERQLNTTRLQLVAGAELQEGFFNTQVAKNKNGNPDTLQTNDDIRNSTYSIFAQADAAIANSWIITAGASINKLNVQFTRLSSYPVLQQRRKYQNEISPRLALQKKWGNRHTVFGSVSKGFSPPTMPELLPSTGVISTFLEAEEGVNYELGGKMFFLNNQLRLEATAFYFKLQQALTARRDSSNADYYVNAGNTKQRGLEISADYMTAFKHPVLKALVVRTAYTLSNFKYGQFTKGSTSFANKYLPGVPKNTLSVLADWQFAKGLYLNTTYYNADKIYLDDANTVAAAGYHLLSVRAGCKITVKKTLQLDMYAGADNLLNETYSLGNDMNAAAGRYYNAAPLRSYYAGIALQWGCAKREK